MYTVALIFNCSISLIGQLAKCKVCNLLRCRLFKYLILLSLIETIKQLGELRYDHIHMTFLVFLFVFLIYQTCLLLFSNTLRPHFYYGS